MACWLFKSEPSAYSWDDLVRDGQTCWDGVRNYQARANLDAMKVGDSGFFYHSIHEKQIVGVVQVVRESYPDDTDPSGRFTMVDIAPVQPVVTPVTLAAIKAEPSLSELPLIRQSRLSVMPIDAASWGKIIAMAGISPYIGTAGGARS